MKIRGLRLLPPLVIGRFGSADEPLENYTIEADQKETLGFRRIEPRETLIVDRQSGEICETKTQDFEFHKEGRVKPVAPFLELWADVDGESKHLTIDDLEKAGLETKDISWKVTVANRKVFRRTNDKRDIVSAEKIVTDHDSHSLEGKCENFIGDDRFIHFGSVRYIKPNARYPGIRFRFTPPAGLIYGPENPPKEPDKPQLIPESRAIYERTPSGSKSTLWYEFGRDKDSIKFFNETMPPSLYAIKSPAPSWLNDDIAISRGYLDDSCDGFVIAELKLGRKSLTAKARIFSAPPVVVPDSVSIRTLQDDLEQAIFGPYVPENEPPDVTQHRAIDIIRRAFETVRFLNVAVMNGNPYEGRAPLTLDTMPAEEAYDTQRLERPIMAEKAMDTLAILALHQQVYAALRGGAAPWFMRLVRRPEEVADYTDSGRRKMPALMCGSDNGYLALTRRQIDTLRVASGTASEPPPGKVTPRNQSARDALYSEITYQAAGNPLSSRPQTSIGNCVPGLEMDFRAVWRRIFEGIELREYDNLVVKVTNKAFKKVNRHRLLRVAGSSVISQKIGPSPSGGLKTVVLSTEDNPHGVAPLEWSNALAEVLYNCQGEKVRCDFSKEASWDEQQPMPENAGKEDFVTLELKVRNFFEGSTGVISEALAKKGELTQGLCSPWQNDYRECSCYYWAASRPDYVNVEAKTDGSSDGDNWLQKTTTGHYVADDYQDSRLILYDDLMGTDPDDENRGSWEYFLRAVKKGRDTKRKFD